MTTPAHDFRQSNHTASLGLPWCLEGTQGAASHLSGLLLTDCYSLKSIRITRIEGFEHPIEGFEPRYVFETCNTKQDNSTCSNKGSRPLFSRFRARGLGQPSVTASL